MFRNLFNRLRGWVRVAVAILAVAAIIWGLGLLRGHKAAETAVAPAAEQKAESPSATPKPKPPAQPPAPKAEEEDMFVLPPSPKGPSPFESPNLKSAKDSAEKVRDGNLKIEAKRKALREKLELDVKEIKLQLKQAGRNLKTCEEVARRPAWSQSITRQAQRDADYVRDVIEELEDKLEKKQKELELLE